VNRIVGRDRDRILRAALEVLAASPPSRGGQAVGRPGNPADRDVVAYRTYLARTEVGSSRKML
jgi:hypothetical protein